MKCHWQVLRNPSKYKSESSGQLIQAAHFLVFLSPPWHVGMEEAPSVWSPEWMYAVDKGTAVSRTSGLRPMEKGSALPSLGWDLVPWQSLPWRIACELITCTESVLYSFLSLGVYSLKIVPLLRLAKPVSPVQLYIINPASLFFCVQSTLSLCSVLYKKQADHPGCWDSPAESPGHPTLAFLCVSLSVFSSFPQCFQSGPSPWRPHRTRYCRLTFTDIMNSPISFVCF